MFFGAKTCVEIVVWQEVIYLSAKKPKHNYYVFLDIFKIFQKIISAVFLPLLLISCSASEDTQLTHQVEVQLSEVFSIGEGNPDDPNYLFSSIASVSVDDNNRIYVAENFGNHLKVFDEQGNFEKQIGREGDGPGEFRLILAMTRNSSGNIVVMDQSSGSVSKFSPDGNYLNQFSMPNPQIRQLSEIADGSYLALYADPDTNQVLHSFNNEFDHLSSFADLDDIIQTEERFEEVISRFLPGKFLVYDENTIYFTPVFYHGLIYQYKKEEGRWTLKNTLEGYTTEPAFTPTDPETDDAYVLNLGNEVLAATIHNESRGLFRTSDDYIIHFTSTRQDKIRVFGAEVFSSDGEFLGYTPIQDQDNGNIYAFYIDKENNVYISDQIDETVLRKYRLNISEISDG